MFRKILALTFLAMGVLTLALATSAPDFVLGMPLGSRVSIAVSGTIMIVSGFLLIRLKD